MRQRFFLAWLSIAGYRRKSKRRQPVIHRNGPAGPRSDAVAAERILRFESPAEVLRRVHRAAKVRERFHPESTSRTRQYISFLTAAINSSIGPTLLLPNCPETNCIATA